VGPRRRRFRLAAERWRPRRSAGTARELEPRVIGVDIYRDKPKPPGTERLAEVLARHKEIVWSFKLQEGAKRAILPPEALRGTERAVLADFIPDSGNMIRRALLYAGDEHEAALRLSTGRSAVKGEAAVRRTHHPFVLMTRFGHLVTQRAHQGGSISPLMIFTTCDASANSVAAIAKVTLTRLSLAA